MEMWVIGSKHEESFADLVKLEDDYELSLNNILPTKEIADRFIDDCLNDSYFSMPVTLISYSHGNTVFEYDTPEFWKNDEDQDEEEN